MKIAILLTCFNRKAKTEACLSNLFEQTLPENARLQVFICDDNSSDGTGEMLAEKFPHVQVVKGDGNQFWGGGMRMAWESAIKTEQFDFYLWLNDDTFLLEDALIDLVENYNAIGLPVILSAACKRPGTNEFSYGGLTNEGMVVPNGSPQKVTYINGNLVLIPKEIVGRIGIVSSKFTHYLGDYDYGLRAQKAGFFCYTTGKYLAECEINTIPYWGDPKLTLKERWKMAHHIKGLALSEYIAYKRQHHGKWVGFKTWVDSYLKVLFPHRYIKLRNYLKR
ncbi:GT2 family glycosyltransferase [Algoriphagus boseongensis]|uniref:GT2 family glycosyltransferase n=1 Tax=Algoriphagus boseongensis TaxID=1442587 RepID=A0A4V3D2L3_9BACT|nr:glycosyltransferase family 2 protein [Algoriphagus boseongensis]TDQ19387.1 GT2 family glycosyltransferase [Algoriphagus boseongensis]